MIPLGLLLVLAAGAVGVAIAIDNTDPTTVAAFGQSYDTTTTGVFLAGVVTGFVLMLGLAMMIAGARRHRARRRVVRSEVRDAHVEREQLAEENARLRAQVETDPYPTTESSPRSGKHTVL